MQGVVVKTEARDGDARLRTRALVPHALEHLKTTPGGDSASLMAMETDNFFRDDGPAFTEEHPLAFLQDVDHLDAQGEQPLPYLPDVADVDDPWEEEECPDCLPSVASVELESGEQPMIMPGMAMEEPTTTALTPTSHIQNRRSAKPRMSALIDHRVFVEGDRLEYKGIPCHVTNHSKAVDQRLKIDVSDVEGLLENLRQLRRNDYASSAQGNALPGTNQAAAPPQESGEEQPAPAQQRHLWEKFTYFPDSADPSHIICSVSHFKLLALWAVGGFPHPFNWKSDLHGYDDKDFLVTTMSGRPLPAPIPLRAIRDEFAKEVDWDFQRGLCRCNPPHESGATLIRLVCNAGPRGERDDDEAQEVNGFRHEREALGPVDYDNLPELQFDAEEFQEKVRSTPFIERLGLQVRRSKDKSAGPKAVEYIKISTIHEVEDFLEELLPADVPRMRGKPQDKPRRHIDYETLLSDDTILALWSRRFQNITDVLSLCKDWPVVRKSFRWMAILIAEDWFLLSKLAAESMLQVCARNKGHLRKALQDTATKSIINNVHARAARKRRRVNARAIDQLWLRLFRSRKQ